MTVIDLYTGNPVALGESPSSEYDNGQEDYNYKVSMEAADVLEICVANLDGVTFQTTVAGDISVEQSNYPCTMNGAITVGSVTIDGKVDNTTTAWDTGEVAPSVISSMDVTGISQLRITCVNNTQLSITLSEEAPVNIGFLTAGGGGAIPNPLPVDFETYEERQRQDDTPAGKVEYTELVGIDQAGAETVVSRFTADGVAYVPVGTPEFNPLPACCFDAREVVPSFKVNGYVLPTLVGKDDGSIFWEEQSAPGVNTGAFGVVIDANPTNTEAITSFLWKFGSAAGIEAFLSDNYEAGAFGVDATDRKSKQRIFIRLFQVDGITPEYPPAPQGNGTISVEATTASYTFAGMFTVPGPVYNVEKIVVRAAGLGMLAEQTSTTEFAVKVRAWQPIVENQTMISDYTYTQDPKTDSSILFIYETPCNAFEFISVPGGSGNDWNSLLASCDQGIEYTNSIVQANGGANGGIDINAVGSDPTDEIGNPGTGFEYTFNTVDGLILKTAISYDTNDV